MEIPNDVWASAQDAIREYRERERRHPLYY